MAYVLTGKKCGIVRFQPHTGIDGVVNKESTTKSSTITDNSVEDGSDLNDHVIRKPELHQINGIVVGGQEALDRLDKMWKTGDIISYEGRTRIKDAVIQNFTATFGADNKKGFGFSLTLKKINIGKAEYMAAGETPLMSQQDKGKSANGTNTAAIKADGLKTTASTNISSSAYASYVSTYNSKPASSAGPSTRSTPSNTGLV